jgi:SAM-dependent methyltransferase
MQSLPFRNDSIDGFISWAALEHVPNPASVMKEVARTLKPGGVAVLAPAWNCREWTVKRLESRPYQGLPLRLKMEKLTIPLRNALVWRAVMCLPRRAKRELASRLFGAVEFDFKPLFPDFSLSLPHTSDDDALASMDPHSAILYFHSRGWEIVSHPGWFSRMSARHEPVVVRKPR